VISFFVNFPKIQLINKILRIFNNFYFGGNIIEPYESISVIIFHLQNRMHKRKK